MNSASGRLISALADRYRIERELGQGGMATVYLADDLRHERKVAVKVLRPELAASIGPERFLREIRIAAQLQHPHILPLHESGEADGFLYYVMPYVDGESLRSRLTRSGELPVHEAVRLIIEVVDALAYAHSRGVVHRDIKPDNVMLSGRHALVMDFGVAKAVSEASGKNQLTTAGVALGTPAYMAPEQAAADPHLDHRVDIYAVGVMAYELLAGRPPFVGGSPQQVLAAHVTQAPEPLSKFRPGIAPALEQAIMRCLAKRAADRWQRAEELMGQLEAVVTPSSGMTPTDTKPIAAIRPTRRWPWILGAATVTIAALIIYAVSHRTVAGPSAPAPIQLTFTGRVQGVRLSPDGAYMAYPETQDCGSGGNCPTFLMLQETSPSGTKRIIDSSGTGFIAGWSPDGRRFLLGTTVGNRNLRSVVTVIGGEVVHSLEGHTAWTASPDSILVWDWVASPQGRTWIKTADANTGIATDSFSFGPAREVTEVLSSPDGRWLSIEFQDMGLLTGTSLVIADRNGRIVDTLPYRWGVAGWGPHSDRLYQREYRGGQPWVVSQAIGANGRQAGQPRWVMRVPVPANISRTSLAYTDAGKPQNEFWVIEWPLGPGKPPVARSIFRTTAQAWASLGEDGESLLIAEDRGGPDSSSGSLTWWKVPLGDGTRTPTSSRENRWYRRWVQDTTLTSYASSEDGTMTVTVAWHNGKTVLTVFGDSEDAAGRELPTTFPDRGWVYVLPDKRIVWQPQNGHEFVILDGQGSIERRLAWPDTLGTSGATLTPDGTAMAVLANRRLGDSTSVSLYRFSLTDGSVSLMGGPLPINGGWVTWAGPWSTDGWLPLRLHDAAGEGRLLRVSLTGGKVVDDGPLPFATVEDFQYTRNRRRAWAKVVTTHGDVMLIRNFDPRP